MKREVYYNNGGANNVMLGNNLTPQTYSQQRYGKCTYILGVVALVNYTMTIIVWSKGVKGSAHFQ